MQWKYLRIIALLGLMGLWMFGPMDRALGNFVELADIDSGLTSPTGDYRWRDVADQLYSADYWDNYNYTQAIVQVVFDSVGSPFHGTLIAVNLKPSTSGALCRGTRSGSTGGWRKQTRF